STVIYFPYALWVDAVCCSCKWFCRKRFGKNCHDLWRTTMVLGIGSGTSSDCNVHSRGASRTQAFAGVCFGAIATAVSGNGKLSATRVAIRVAIAWSFSSTDQSRSAALGLHV